MQAMNLIWGGNMPDFDPSSSLWPDGPGQPFFAQLNIVHRQQVGGTCVSTGLSLLTGESPAAVRQQINTQNPVSWSVYLQAHGMKLAYCPTDLRRLKHYVPELLAHHDLFTLSTYSPLDAQTIGSDPDSSGWVCGSHFVVLYQDTVYDTRWSQPVALRDYPDLERYVKRMFRVVPVNHPRGL